MNARDVVVPRARAALPLLALPLALPALASCAAVAGAPQAESCVSWADLATDAEREEASTLVIDARVVGQDRDRTMLGTTAHAWVVEVVDVVQGDADPGGLLSVASTPTTCTGEDVYPAGDPLDVDETVRLYLTDAPALPDTAEGWSLITPFDGVGQAG
ncbi:hypothetical protein IF650_05460 [Cellulosimicrobium terreum]|nr:hypothetical protein [Cellulosimicrobium terreum]